MNTDEFEALLEGATETTSLDFKAAMDWSPNSLVKDMLAMANVQDGGRIVVGVNNDLSRTGMSDSQLATFSEEIMQDQVAEYADPYVNFHVLTALDRAGLKFTIIDIAEFELSPVICRKGGLDVNRGDIYYRSPSGRPASARVAKEHDLRDILDRAVVKLMSKRKNQGYETPMPNYEQVYDEELGDL